VDRTSPNSLLLFLREHLEDHLLQVGPGMADREAADHSLGAMQRFVFFGAGRTMTEMAAYLKLLLAAELAIHIGREQVLYFAAVHALLPVLIAGPPA
jgi:hypothetical protein